MKYLVLIGVIGVVIIIAATWIAKKRFKKRGRQDTPEDIYPLW
jgi:hypothetical protein